MEKLHLVVGLGNPGKEYAQTRHNAGFMVTALLANRWQAGWTNEKRFECRLARALVNGVRVFMAQPVTYMNASGKTVAALASFYDVTRSRILVVVDDADLQLGCLRLRPEGSAGGHHGLESIERCLGSREYARLKVGIGRREGAREITGHVLGRFESTEKALLDKVLLVACQQAECWIEHGAQKAMNQFNGTLPDPESEGKEK